MDQNAVTAPLSRARTLTDEQQMACQVIPQALSLALSMRELIRQGYLFEAHVLLRAFVERASILLYLHLCPEDIDRWQRGWQLGDAPNLSKMFDVIQSKLGRSSIVRGSELTKSMNSLLHGKPDCAAWNTIFLSDKTVGHAVSKTLSRPDLCDDLCANVIPWIAVVQAIMAAYFPEQTSNNNHSSDS